MPIDYGKYHPMFKRISRFVRLIRAGNKCEQCGVANYSVLEYAHDQLVNTYPYDEFAAAREFARQRNKACTQKGERFSVVVLTTAHLDHDVDNNELDNLKALCQRCHLSHDRLDNAQKRMYGPTGRHFNQIKLSL